MLTARVELDRILDNIIPNWVRKAVTRMVITIASSATGTDDVAFDTLE